MESLYFVSPYGSRSPVFCLLGDVPRGNADCVTTEDLLRVLRRGDPALAGLRRNTGPVWSVVESRGTGDALSVRRRYFACCPVEALVILVTAGACPEEWSGVLATALIEGSAIMLTGTPEHPSEVLGVQPPLLA